MECKNAYIPAGEKTIFCKKSPQPGKTDTKARMHAMCPFQRFCPNVRNCVMLPGWEKCRRLDENAPQAAEDGAGEKKKAKSGTAKRKKNNAADGE